MDTLLERRLADLQCPDCRGALEHRHDQLVCNGCQRTFLQYEGALDLTPKSFGDEKSRIATFWGDIYRQVYESEDASYSSEALRQSLVELQDLFEKREHLSAVEMGEIDLAGKDLLEIGSGAGGHSALFRSRGASLVSVDITPERVLATHRKLQLLSDLPGDGVAARADAENLPFRDASFDVVFSNGVLHHTSDTTRAVREVHRVLRPGGRVVLMLYSRHSALYWMHLLPKALLSGKFFTNREEEWIGYFTEGRPKFSNEHNPITRVYSKRQLRELLSAFRQLRMRKTSFFITYLPIPGISAMRSKILRRLGHKEHQGGMLVYGSATMLETPVERMLGHHVGFAWNITAIK
ncbi:MAG TPA: class I SAM-dependent methyltransferase [Thermoanaerobaculia bacterium]|nr:class I SAM-dependent methyltransferase [Thermoanaerobaculia bacterium]